MRFSSLLLLCGSLSLAGCKPVNGPPSAVDAGGHCAAVTLGTGLRLLTRAEYDHTVRDLLGDTSGPAVNFPREPLQAGLDNDAALLRVSDDGLSRYLAAAEALSADTLKNRRARLLPCSSSDLTCGTQFIETFGLRAYRRPLESEERDDLQQLFSGVLAASGFDHAVAWTAQAMLQAPQFLYRDEAPHGTLPQAVVTLSGYELASRLSYFVWATTPDDELLEAARSGALDEPQGLTAQAQRLLADPRALDGLLRFFSLWLYLDGVQTTEKNAASYPLYTPGLAQAWRTSLELFITDSLQREGTLAGLLSSSALFTNDAMAFYGPPVASSEFIRTEVPGQRHGLLTQPGFLAFKALPDSSSPVRRGVFVLNNLICQPPPPPPAGVPISPPKPSTSLTTRARFEDHIADPGCSACHAFIDPPGNTFEHYDGLGVWRDTENGQPIDATGGIVNANEASLVTAVDGVPALERVLSGSRQVHDCVAKTFYQFALGRDLTQADSCTLTQVGDRFMGSGGSFKELMLAIIEADSFRTNANPELTP
jgi:hypothetical protein